MSSPSLLHLYSLLSLLSLLLSPSSASILHASLRRQSSSSPGRQRWPAGSSSSLARRHCPRGSSSPSLGAAGAAKCDEGGGVRRTSYKLGEEGSRRCRQETHVRAPRGPAAELHCVTELGRGGPPSEEGRPFLPRPPNSNPTAL
jgi:hypothetical protein